ncbi:hypothetical protein ARMGADRAFT_1069476 [Armillaria gallica]|uniref:Uncharacterized protein n=1 Tax=Armillaria gallica TaxID=47427 RepID=A0A2H3C8B5_ARMGA|nr:hypothetical protein ARMGADRAFT_1069476 [Armillaria gallica]
MFSEETTSYRRSLRGSYCFATSLSLIIIVATTCVALILKLHPGGESSYAMNPVGTRDRTIFLSAAFVSADIPQTTMLVDWLVEHDTCNVNCSEVKIFFDKNVSPGSIDGPSSNNRPRDPTFIWNATVGMTLINHSSYDILGNSPTFRTNYWSDIFAFAQEVSTNNSVNLDLGLAYPMIIDLKLTTKITRKEPPYSDDMDLKQGVIGAIITLQRSPLIIGYCLVITATFWMVTLMICFIMITTVVFGYRQRNEIVVVPIGTVFTFTQLRSSMPGAPKGFGGILDYLGLLPCLILLSICAMTMVGIYLFTDPHDPSREAFTWDELVNVLRFIIRRICKTVSASAQRGRLCIRRARRRTSNVIEIPSDNLD